MKKYKKKSTLDILKEVRTMWSINPRTRVQENEKKDKKKRRESAKKLVREDIDE